MEKNENRIKMKTVFLWIVSIVLALAFFLNESGGPPAFGKASVFVLLPLGYGIFKLFQNMRRKRREKSR